MNESELQTQTILLLLCIKTEANFLYLSEASRWEIQRIIKFNYYELQYFKQ
jgi:hypothetical protein